jgi:flagellar biosynthetic protein FliR
MPDLTLLQVQHFLLIFFRMSGLFVTAPVFGSVQIPPPVKIWLSVIMAILMFPAVPMPAEPPAPNLAGYAAAAGGELAVGILLGLAAQILFLAVQMGGLIVGQELGLTMANVIDPITNEQVSVISQFKLLLAILIYLAVDGHHVLIRAVTQSFGTIPLRGLSGRPEALLEIGDRMMVGMLQVSIQMAAPALVSLFLVTVALGFMARTVPEMNIFSVGFSLRVLLGMAIVAISIDVFRWVFLTAYENSVFDLVRLLSLMKPG